MSLWEYDNSVIRTQQCLILTKFHSAVIVVYIHKCDTKHKSLDRIKYKAHLILHELTRFVARLFHTGILMFVVCVCVCVCIYVHIYLCVFASVCVCVFVFLFASKCVYIIMTKCVYVYMYMCTCMCVHAYVHYIL